MCLLTKEEQCALRYVAGYVVCKIYKRMDSGSHPQKKEMMFLLLENNSEARNC